MSCNPAIGGVGKGHLVREVDALDGLIGRAADMAAIHYRMLNRSKGRAVWGPRVQADRRLFAAAVQQALARQAGLEIIEGEAAELILEGGRVAGVRLASGDTLRARAVVLATGTFLGGRMFRGREVFVGGRTGEGSAVRLSDQLREMFLLGRMKTGTPPRLDGRYIDWACLPEQPSDAEPWRVSPLSDGPRPPQLRCAITRTTPTTHAIIAEGFAASPLVGGAISGPGPRYCPSVEDKVVRFPDRDGHQIFLEPEGLDTPLVYPNGISTSLSRDIQDRLVASIPGCERAPILAYGYAVEYDHVDPRALDHGLGARDLLGLYFAGQVNGTTGYEEAAAQGLVAGLSAGCAVQDRRSPHFDRADSYIGVLVDDLVLQGVTEPYRMLTARAEHRLRLRADNAATRLTPIGLEYGCIGEERRRWFEQHQANLAVCRDRLALTCSASQVLGEGAERKTIRAWLRDPRTDAAALLAQDDARLGDAAAEVAEDVLYAPYVERDARQQPRGDLAIAQLDFSRIGGLSNEMVEKLAHTRPRTLADLERIRGITPAAVAAVAAHAAMR